MRVITVYLLPSGYCWRIRLVKVYKSIHNNDNDMCLLFIFVGNMFDEGVHGRNASLLHGQWLLIEMSSSLFLPPLNPYVPNSHVCGPTQAKICVPELEASFWEHVSLTTYVATWKLVRNADSQTACMSFRSALRWFRCVPAFENHWAGRGGRRLPLPLCLQSWHFDFVVQNSHKNYSLPLHLIIHFLATS